MASEMYAGGLQAFAEGRIAWLTDPIQCCLVDTTRYAFNRAHRSLADLPMEARIGGVQTLEGKTCPDGVLDALDVTFRRLTGPTCSAIAIWKAAERDTDATLICFLTEADGLPVTPQGGDAVVQWDDGEDKIVKL